MKADITFIKDLYHMGFNNEYRKLRMIETINSISVQNTNQSFDIRKNQISKVR